MRETVYFDHAATAHPRSAAVEAALLHCLREADGNPGRSGHPLALAAEEVLYNAREAVAVLCGTEEVERVVLTGGATFSLNLALYRLARPGCRVLISDREHNAVYRTAFRLCRDLGGRLLLFRAGDLADFAKMLSQGVDLVATLHASNVTGEVYPAEEMAALCQERGIPLVLDAAQSAGHLPLGGAARLAAALCAPGHKALGGIPGAGFLLLSEKEGGKEFLTGGSGSLSYSPEMPQALPDRYEAGTPPTPAIAAMAAGIWSLGKRRDFDLENLPKREVAHRQRPEKEPLEKALQAEKENAAEGAPLAIEEGLALRRQRIAKIWHAAYEGLSSLPGITLYSKDPRCGILAFNLAHMPSEEVAAALSRQGICTRAGLHCAPLAHQALGTLAQGGCVRLSFGEENTLDEVAFFLEVMEGLLKRGEEKA